MARKVPIGVQSFVKLRENNCFYVDKTYFIKDWWDSLDDVTVILRPRRFGKTLTMSMIEAFFSTRYEKRADLFEGLAVWENDIYRELQGTYPVIFLTFAGIKKSTYEEVISQIADLIVEVYAQFDFICDGDKLSDTDKEYFMRVRSKANNVDWTSTLKILSRLLFKYYGKKPLILLDEYDTPMQEAYVNGYWEEMSGFVKNFFNASFKSNTNMERALMTGITRVSKESIFSDFNHVLMVSTLSQRYETAIGFTEEEVFAAMDEYGLTNKDEVKFWYDGFTFGQKTDIYNPWSIVNYLADRSLDTHWANTSENTLVSTILKKGSNAMKTDMEVLLNGGSIDTDINEHMVFSELDVNDVAAWSLLMASGYLTGDLIGLPALKHYRLRITNYETIVMFQRLISSWFSHYDVHYNDFVKSLLSNDLEMMNLYMNQVALITFSSFDTGRKFSLERLPERFYHGFVLGLIADLRDRYIVTSNRESGLGRYDVMLEPRDKKSDDGIIIEFKVRNEKKEGSLEETVQVALQQIEDKKYEVVLVEKGVPTERIRKYGFAFEGQTVLIDCR